ncbi:hypothetical protein T492DRAFT_1085291 [Pavlovales sp. CCMP2436]|nr:hypothetical protein T492DRAFT_1085291 [Pavlovales sp. CCMP2436]
MIKAAPVRTLLMMIIYELDPSHSERRARARRSDMQRKDKEQKGASDLGQRTRSKKGQAISVKGQGAKSRSKDKEQKGASDLGQRTRSKKGQAISVKGQEARSECSDAGEGQRARRSDMLRKGEKQEARDLSGRARAMSE